MREKRGYNMNIKEVEKVTGLTKQISGFMKKKGWCAQNEMNRIIIVSIQR